jgi:hypothetical protein
VSWDTSAMPVPETRIEQVLGQEEATEHPEDCAHTSDVADAQQTRGPQGSVCLQNDAEA